MSSIVPFDSGNSYVVRELPSEDNEKPRSTDRLGRTAQDRRFLDQFEKIFKAASKGKLEKCQSIVNEGYRDFNATSFGKFGTSSGGYLNGISPIKIAEMNGHQHIVEFFQKIANESKSLPVVRESSLKMLNLQEQMSSLQDDLANIEQAADEGIVEIKQGSSGVVQVDQVVINSNFVVGEENRLDRFQGHHARVTTYSDLCNAIKLNFTLKALEDLADKVTELDENIWNLIFPKSQDMLTFYLQECAKEHARTGNEYLTSEFNESYWGHFSNKPKPYLPFLTPYSSSFILKILDKQGNFPLCKGELFGRVEETVLRSLFKPEDKFLPFHFKHLLLYGYSDELVLNLCDRFNEGELDSDVMQIAKLRGYSDEVIQKLEGKCPKKCIVM